MKFLSGKKTYIVAIVMIAYSLVVTGWSNKDWNGAFEQILVALGMGGLRSGIANK